MREAVEVEQQRVEVAEGEADRALLLNTPQVSSRRLNDPTYCQATNLRNVST